MEDIIDKKVNVFLVGSRKSGTTSLANFLSSHKDISLSSTKEPDYFHNIISGPINDYHELFEWNKKIQLEASTSYTSNLDSTFQNCLNIEKYNPKAKIIYIVRQPIDRIRSHYRMSYERGDLNVSLNEALKSHRLLIDCSKYYSQINNYIQTFSKENVLILNNEDLNSKKTETSLVKFLGLSTGFDTNIGTDNSASADYRMPRDMDSILNNKLYAFIKLLFPISFIKYFKTKYYNKINSGMNLNLNEESKQIIKEELITEMVNLQKFISFDISKWIEQLKSL